jgi:hypothetical protein
VSARRNPKRSSKVPEIPGVDVDQLRGAAHSLSNAATAVLANWFLVREHLIATSAPPDVLAMAADIDVAGKRMVEELSVLTITLNSPRPRVTP